MGSNISIRPGLYILYDPFGVERFAGISGLLRCDAFGIREVAPALLGENAFGIREVAPALLGENAFGIREVNKISRGTCPFGR